jgi:peptidyl-prolyl cis-trans isomerase SurA
MKKTFIAVICAFLVATGLRADILEQILVKVNGEILTKTDLEKLQIAAIRERASVNPNGLSDAELGKALAEVTPRVIVEAVDELLLLQRARTLGLAVTDEAFKNVLDSIKKDNKIESEEAFQAALKQEGMTLPQLRRVLERRMLIGRVQQAEVMGHIDITEAEEKAFYDAHQSEFATQPSVTLREIMINVPTDPKGVNAAAIEDARKKAETVRARVVGGGEAYDKVASDASDAPSKSNGGLIGPIAKSELASDLAKMLGSMKPGEVSPVVRVAGGFEILKLESSSESTMLPFADAKSQIAEKLGQERQGAEMQKYLKKLRDQALIEWKNDEIKKAYQAGLAAQEKQGA